MRTPTCCPAPGYPEVLWPPDQPQPLVPLPARRFNCRHYDHCLSDAVAAGWPSWSCAACTAYASLAPEEFQQDRDGLLRLWQLVANEAW